MSSAEESLPTHLRSGALDRAPGVVLLATLAVGALGLGMALRIPGNDESILRGEWTAALEKDVDQRVPWREPSISGWGIVEFLLFSDGRPGVLVGSPGWLFTAEEFEDPPGSAVETGFKLELVRAVDRHLKARNVELVVVVVPAKARIYEEHLGRHVWPRVAKGRYDAFREALHNDGIAAPDVVRDLLSAKGDRMVYNRTDTHWTPEGAAVVASSVARDLRFPGRGSGTWKRAELEPVEQEGDLRSFVPLGPLQDRIPLETVTPFEARQDGDGGLGLFDEVAIPVALVGTSYSAEPLWSFDDALRLELQADVLLAADEGAGPVVPMLAYLANPAFAETPPEVVIWEFPERYLPVKADLTEHTELLEVLHVAEAVR